MRLRTHVFVSTGIALGVVVFDRLTKIIFSDILTVGESILVVKNIFHITLVHNTGIAFGLFKDSGAVFIIVPMVVVVAMGVYVYRHRKQSNFAGLPLGALALISGGALGNLIDRIMFGHVIDFLDFRVWPVFNVADSAITIGMVMVIIDHMIQHRLSAKPLS